MVGRINVGGGVVTTAWAYIAVTYPAGSTCTATNGTTTLTAQGTSGLYVFQIPEPTTTPETWTVSCTNGTRTSTAQVEISTQYSAATVSLSYSRLPAEYQEVEYIESPSSGGYINQTFTAPTIDEQIEIDFMMLENLTHSVFGTSYAYLPVFGLCHYSHIELGDTLAYYWGSSAGNAIVASTATVGTKIAAVINDANHAIKENGTQISTTALSGNNIEARVPLGGMFDYNGSYGIIETGKTRFYKYIRTNLSTDTVIQNLVPCYRLSDSRIGLYDLANSTFMQPSGSGTWLKGADV